MARFNRRFERMERRMVRRGFRRAFGLLPPLPIAMLPELAQANRLLAAGQSAQAAPMLETLANTARTRGLPRTPRLFFQAARANWSAGQVARGIELMHTALDMLAAVGAVGIASNITSLAEAELNTLGHKAEADQLRDYATKIPEWQEAAVEPEEKAKLLLPTHCPQCGAVVRSDEVDWIDEDTADCAYCGSPMRKEKT